MAFFSLRSKLSVFSLPVIFLALSLIDVYIPGFLWSLNDFPLRPVWFQQLNEYKILGGALFYLFFFILFLTTYFLSVRKAPFNSIYLIHEYQIKSNVFSAIILIFSSMSVFSLLHEIYYIGSFSEWLVVKFMFRFQNDLGGLYSTSLGFITHVIPWRIMLISIIFVGFLFRDYLSRKTKWLLYFSTLLAFILTISTSYRGSILIFFLGFAFIEFVRYKFLGLQVNRHFALKKILYLVFISVLIFIVYGVLRESGVNEYEGVSVDNKPSEVYRVLSQGSGLEGVSNIIDLYGSSVDYMFGKTYLDMLLMPVPRSIYSSKPDWYGIDDITRGMGWPESTQSAVTMAGEAYANFSYFGLIIGVGYGVVLGLIVRVMFSNPILLTLYPTVIIQMILVTNWMGFTGFMNAFLKSLVILVIFIFIKRVIVR